MPEGLKAKRVFKEDDFLHLSTASPVEVCGSCSNDVGISHDVVFSMDMDKNQSSTKNLLH